MDKKRKFAKHQKNCMEIFYKKKVWVKKTTKKILT